MNENLKHSLLNLYLYIAAAVLSLSLIYSQYPLAIAVVVVLSGIIYVLLALVFFGSKELIPNVLKFIKQNLFNIFVVMIVFVCPYVLIINPIVTEARLRMILFLGFLVSWTILSLRIRNFSNLRLIKTFFKENLILMDRWIATDTNNEQQTDYREIQLHGNPLRQLLFTIRPSSPFWRAGFKLTDPNGTILPLRTNNSLLFHLGSTESEDKFGITAYINGEWVESLNKTLPLDKQKPISIKFEVNDKNFTKCFINDQVEFESATRINPQIFKRAFLAAWSDGHNMKVEFDSVGYLTR
ncbi:hypothetical protein KKB83_00155 [Patescibacteria group bacterium]|nr:hypothetical protein [Patescibacteria group bacterium]